MLIKIFWNQHKKDVYFYFSEKQTDKQDVICLICEMYGNRIVPGKKYILSGGRHLLCGGRHLIYLAAATYYVAAAT